MAQFELLGKAAGPDVILFYGPPGSGKSFFYMRYLTNYHRFNNDTAKLSQSDFKSKVIELLEQGKNIVIDNLNAKR